MNIFWQRKDINESWRFLSWVLGRLVLFCFMVLVLLASFFLTYFAYWGAIVCIIPSFPPS